MLKRCSNPRHKFPPVKWYSPDNLEPCSLCGICIPYVNAQDSLGHNAFERTCYYNFAGLYDSAIREMLLCGAKYDMTNMPDRKLIENFEKEQKEAIRILRPALVACAYQVLPLELAELCGDYCCMTKERRAVEERLNAK